MSDIGDFLSKKKIDKSMSKPENYECFVSGKELGLGSNPVPCVLDSVAGQTAKVTIADGHDTGVQREVPITSVDIVSEKKFNQAAKDLFQNPGKE